MDVQTRAALELVVQDRDDAQRRADDFTAHQARRDEARAEVRVLDMVLATFAGTLGFSERRTLELELTREAAARAARTRREVPIEHSGRFPDVQWSDAPAVPLAPPDVPPGLTDADMRRLEGQEPMGSWEPRS